MNPLRYLLHCRDKPKDSLNGSRFSFFFGGTSSGKQVLLGIMDNIYIRTDSAENIKPGKEKSTKKIDGPVATIMALDRALRNGGTAGTSVYETRVLLIFS